MMLVWFLFSKSTGDIKKASTQPVINKKAPKGLVWDSFLVEKHVLKHLSQYRVVKRGSSLGTQLKTVSNLLVS